MNAVGDVLLAPTMGITGVAIATAASQWAGGLAYALFLALRRPSQAVNEGADGEASQWPASGGVTLRWAGLPTRQELQPFVDIASAVVSRNLFVMGAYMAMTKVASGMGVIEGATHQIGLTVFWLFSCVVEPISIAAQTLVARDMHLPVKARDMAITLLYIGGALGVLLAGVSSATLHWVPWLFTRDPVIQESLRSIVPHSAVAFPVCGLMMTMDGLNVGSQAMEHVPRLNLVALLGVSSYLTWVSRSGQGLQTMWWSLLLFYVLRAGQNALQFFLERRTNVFSSDRAVEELV